MLTSNQLSQILNSSHSTPTSEILDESENREFVHPLYKKSSQDNSTNKKKWMFSFFLAACATFVFSRFFLSFLDEMCLKKEISMFDASGQPKLILIMVIFATLLVLNRISFALI